MIRIRGLMLSALVLLLMPRPLRAQNCSRDGLGAPPFNGVGFANVAVPGFFPNFSAITQGTSFWNNSLCGNTDGAGLDFPYFAVSAPQFPATLTISMANRTRSSEEVCRGHSVLRGGANWPNHNRLSILGSQRNNANADGHSDAVCDLDADGDLDWCGWTAGNTAQAFLWKDRNGNSMVDDASELFGDATPLSDGDPALNGFEALRELDTNADLVIDHNDAGWQSLKLWFDTNHDGVSSEPEVRDLADYVCAMRLTYYDSRRTDAHGNQLRYVAGLEQRRPNGTCIPRLVYDVIFVRQ